MTANPASTSEATTPPARAGRRGGRTREQSPARAERRRPKQEHDRQTPEPSPAPEDAAQIDFSQHPAHTTPWRRTSALPATKRLPRVGTPSTRTVVMTRELAAHVDAVRVDIGTPNAVDFTLLTSSLLRALAREHEDYKIRVEEYRQTHGVVPGPDVVPPGPIFTALSAEVAIVMDGGTAP
ncbi:hypothetical protein [Kitasatospora viridis]|nr:hypothetical protein [Kitasatospora viridis]